MHSFQFGAGRLIFDYDNGTIRKQGYIKDHLGNVMLTFEDKNDNGVVELNEDTTPEGEEEIVQRELYYPFGMSVNSNWWEHAPAPVDVTSQDYKYNGKELDESFGLNWYFYGARMYDPAVGRFTGVDPIADQFAFVSVYNYAENEPVRHIDLWGLQATLPNGETGPYSNEYANEQWENHEIDKIKRQNLGSDGLSATRPHESTWYADPQWVDDNMRSGDQFSDGTEVVTTPSERETARLMLFSTEIVLGRYPVSQRTYRAPGRFNPALPGYGNAAKTSTGLLPMLTQTTRQNVLTSAQVLNRNGLSAVGRALQKHAGRPGPFSNIRFSHKTGNQQGLDVLNDILNSKNPIIQDAGNGGYRIFDGTTGRGFGLSRDGLFNGFRQL